MHFYSRTQAFSRLDPSLSSPTHVPYSFVDSVARCPAGTPLTYPGKLTVRSVAIGGCMIASDANFKSMAMYHVPGDCSTSADYAKGCVFPGALNYAPGSIQGDGKCLYKLNGCV